jgi:hypothetical protein
VETGSLGRLGKRGSGSRGLRRLAINWRRVAAEISYRREARGDSASAVWRLRSTSFARPVWEWRSVTRGGASAEGNRRCAGDYRLRSGNVGLPVLVAPTGYML